MKQQGIFFYSDQHLTESLDSSHFVHVKLAPPAQKVTHTMNAKSRRHTPNAARYLHFSLGIRCFSIEGSTLIQQRNALPLKRMTLLAKD